MSVYLDYNATTPIDPRVLDVMIDVYRNHPGNADSRTHDYGEAARKITENARHKVAELLNVTASEVFFTSGATESNNIAIQGLHEYAEKTGKKHIVTTAIEHKSVLNTAKYMAEHGYEVDFIKPDLSGRVSSEDILSHVRENTLLVSVMHVNNETGIIQPVNEIGEALTKRNVLFHVDATQSCGKLVNEIRNLKYDMLSFSAHKFRGPQGIGALVLRRKNYHLPPVRNITFGGQQENGIRPGTTPVALVAGMGKACELAASDFKNQEKTNKAIRKSILKILNDSGISYHFNGNPEYSVSSTINICFDGIASEALMLSTKQFCAISNGSACTSKSYEPSYVLTAMGIPTEQIQNSVRISWGPGINPDEVTKNFIRFVERIKEFI
ncbi:MAG: aminotransferase class V-fold PLP-dependent enzyme [Solobacterium sp.]|jgi:cysteine desulfurase|nr:aminotransferase class V-fold PLP-dependent enzyme [Solobacterium sp.]MCH4048347.1 aminotransferase class V-fold PLP-dependent enzyme [Solobacterium sp.]MCH4074801.1 aminotransferase class V-fold PLP-dependent enzyme [Solobacterium sp.]